MHLNKFVKKTAPERVAVFVYTGFFTGASLFHEIPVVARGVFGT
jgi:hypothetical protein